MSVEWLMIFALGFLTASLSVLAIIPFVHARATRLAARRVMLDVPISMTEIQAAWDAQRAEFAVATRRLEMRIDELTERLTKLMADLGSKSDYIRRLEIELSATRAQAPALSECNRGMRASRIVEDLSEKPRGTEDASLPQLLPQSP